MRRLIFGSLSFFLLAPMTAPAVRAEIPSWDSSDSSVEELFSFSYFQ